MTLEEAIELKAAVGRLMYSGNKDVRDYNALIDFIESALRPVSREQAEKIRGEWVQNRNAIIDSIMCSKCGAIYQAYYGGYPYCPRCGAPMTDEAVQMVMERLEAMRDETETD